MRGEEGEEQGLDRELRVAARDARRVAADRVVVGAARGERRARAAGAHAGRGVRRLQRDVVVVDPVQLAGQEGEPQKNARARGAQTYGSTGTLNRHHRGVARWTKVEKKRSGHIYLSKMARDTPWSGTRVAGYTG